MVRPVLLMLCFPFCLVAQISPHKYFIHFTDKNNSAFSVSNPSAFLSDRSIMRRTNQNIAVTEQDLPVNKNYIDSVSSTGAIVLTRSKWFNGVTVQCDSATLNSILSLPFVANSKQVYRLSPPRE